MDAHGRARTGTTNTANTIYRQNQLQRGSDNLRKPKLAKHQARATPPYRRHNSQTMACDLCLSRQMPWTVASQPLCAYSVGEPAGSIWLG